MAKVGRPAKYETPELLQDKIDEYFKNEVGEFPLLDEDGKHIFNKFGEIVTTLKPPTVSGLALYLGFSDRSSMYDYKNKKENKEFSRTIKKAIARIVEFAETRLYVGGKPTGAIFWLKNHGWKDKTEVDNKHELVKMGKVTIKDKDKELKFDIGEEA